MTAKEGPAEADRHKALAAALAGAPSWLFILLRENESETGMLVSWVQQCSFEPPLLSLALRQGRDLLAWLMPGVCLPSTCWTMARPTWWRTSAGASPWTAGLHGADVFAPRWRRAGAGRRPGLSGVSGRVAHCYRRLRLSLAWSLAAECSTRAGRWFTSARAGCITRRKKPDEPHQPKDPGKVAAEPDN